MLIQRSENLGAWAGKLNAFQFCFDSGADFVLLIEEDVFLYPDAISCASKAYEASKNFECLVTISLYSNNLLDFPNSEYQEAIDFMKNNQEVFAECGIRSWPFPWGIGLSRKSHLVLKELGWNGNDQSMGNLLKDQNGVDIFPIITRSEHLGQSKFDSNYLYPVLRHKMPENVDKIFRSDPINFDENCDKKHLTDVADY